MVGIKDGEDQRMWVVGSRGADGRVEVVGSRR